MYTEAQEDYFREQVRRAYPDMERSEHQAFAKDNYIRRLARQLGVDLLEDYPPMSIIDDLEHLDYYPSVSEWYERREDEDDPAAYVEDEDGYCQVPEAFTPVRLGIMQRLGLIEIDGDTVIITEISRQAIRPHGNCPWCGLDMARTGDHWECPECGSKREDIDGRVGKPIYGPADAAADMALIRDHYTTGDFFGAMGSWDAKARRVIRDLRTGRYIRLDLSDERGCRILITSAGNKI